MAIVGRKNQMDFIINSYENGALLDSDEIRKLDKEAEIREVDRQERILDLQRTINSKANEIIVSPSDLNANALYRAKRRLYSYTPKNKDDWYGNKLFDEYTDELYHQYYEKMEENKYKRSDV